MSQDPKPSRASSILRELGDHMDFPELSLETGRRTGHIQECRGNLRKMKY